MHLLAIGTLKVRIFDNRDGCIRVAANVISRANGRWMQAADHDVMPQGRVGDANDESRVEKQAAQRKYDEKAYKEVPPFVIVLLHLFSLSITTLLERLIALRRLRLADGNCMFERVH
jgi:hypothetical protein